jgi:hypothetical protein
VPLAWLVIPETQTVEIYRGDGSAQEVCQPAELAGERPVQGFVLRLERIWKGIP